MGELSQQLSQHVADEGHALLDDDGQVTEAARDFRPSGMDVRAEDAAPGRAAQLDCGVIYQGDWRKPADGLSRHIREQALALSTALPVSLRAFGVSNLLDHELDPGVLEQAGYLARVTFRTAACAVRQAVFNEKEELRNLICPAGARLAGTQAEKALYACTVVYTSWERDRVAGSLVRELRKVGEVWVPCGVNREAFITSGLARDRVVEMPYPYEPASHLTTALAAPRGKPDVPAGRRFYHIAKWEPRKGQHEILGAFLCAFGPRERVCLTLKTYGWGKWQDYPSPVESVQAWSTDPAVLANGWSARSIARLVRIDTERISDQEIAALHAQNNIYVSASHGEAWDLPAFDARCLGNALVWVGYGGADSYTEPGPTAVRVPYALGPVHSGYKWEPASRWAHYRHEDLVEALRQVAVPDERWHPSDFPRRFGRHAVGRKMAARVLALALKRDRELGRRLWNAGSYG